MAAKRFNEKTARAGAAKFLRRMSKDPATRACDDLLAACKVQGAALHACVLFLLGNGPQPDPEAMAEAVLVGERAITKAEAV